MSFFEVFFSALTTCTIFFVGSNLPCGPPQTIQPASTHWNAQGTEKRPSGFDKTKYSEHSRWHSWAARPRWIDFDWQVSALFSGDWRDLFTHYFPKHENSAAWIILLLFPAEINQSRGFSFFWIKWVGRIKQQHRLINLCKLCSEYWNWIWKYSQRSFLTYFVQTEILPF